MTPYCGHYNVESRHALVFIFDRLTLNIGRILLATTVNEHDCARRNTKNFDSRPQF